MKIEIDLSEEEWAEVYYALDSKAAGVADGRYGTSPEWHQTLVAIRRKVAEALSEKGVSY
jgi:hypothetical protein